jgi:hypothetical protein
MYPGAGAHSVDASKPDDLGSGTYGNGRSASSTSTRFAARAVSTAFSALASMGVSSSHPELTLQTSFVLSTFPLAHYSVGRSHRLVAGVEGFISWQGCPRSPEM